VQKQIVLSHDQSSPAASIHCWGPG